MQSFLIDNREDKDERMNVISTHRRCLGVRLNKGYKRKLYIRAKLMATSMTLLIAVSMGSMAVYGLGADRNGLVEPSMVSGSGYVGTPNGALVNTSNTSKANIAQLSNTYSQLGSMEPKVVTLEFTGPLEVGTLEKPEKPEIAKADRMEFHSTREALELDIREPSNWSHDDFAAVVGKDLQCLIPTVLNIEEETGINAVYLMGVAATETLWGKQLANDLNYFNWSTDGLTYYPFESIEELEEYTTKQYSNKYSQPDFYVTMLRDLKDEPDVINLPLVNRVYAIEEDGTCNERWKVVLSEVMVIMTRRLTEYEAGQTA